MRDLKSVLEGDFELNLTEWTLSSATGLSFDGLAIVGYGTNPSGNTEAWIVRLPPNAAPTAVAGADQSIRAGDTVFLDGSGSFDDNTASEDLVYAWTLFAWPEGSFAELSDADTDSPSFVADEAGTYFVHLIVTDWVGLSSAPDDVVVSSDNLAPTANAGDDQLLIVGETVFLDGSGSIDPEEDPLAFDWEIISAPVESTAALSSADEVNPTFVPDLEGVYIVELIVSDFLGPGDHPDTVAITAATGEDFAEVQIVMANDVVTSLQPDQVTTEGNQTALLQFLSQAVVFIQSGNTAAAIFKLEEALERTDGCVLREAPDGDGPGRDWIRDCTAQVEAYNLLNDALDALTESAVASAN